MHRIHSAALSVLFLLHIATAQDLKLIKRSTAEIKMLADAACSDEQGQPLTDNKLSTDDSARLSTNIRDLLAQLTTLKAQIPILKQLGISNGDTTAVEAQIKALDPAGSLCVRAKAFAGSTTSAIQTAPPPAASSASLTLAQATSQVKNLQPLACPNDPNDKVVSFHHDELDKVILFNVGRGCASEVKAYN